MSSAQPACCCAEEGAADVISLAVHPGYRRQGIGTALIETIERRANDLGIRKLNLDVGSNAREAISFYLASASTGWTRMTRRKAAGTSRRSRRRCGRSA